MGDRTPHCAGKIGLGIRLLSSLTPWVLAESSVRVAWACTRADRVAQEQRKWNVSVRCAAAGISSLIDTRPLPVHIEKPVLWRDGAGQLPALLQSNKQSAPIRNGCGAVILQPKLQCIISNWIYYLPCHSQSWIIKWAKMTAAHVPWHLKAPGVTPLCASLRSNKHAECTSFLIEHLQNRFFRKVWQPALFTSMFASQSSLLLLAHCCAPWHIITTNHWQ